MLNSQVLEVAIGLIFVFLIASLLATALRELLEGLLKTRSVHLERGIRQLLDDPDGRNATKDLFDHPQLFGLFDGVYDPATLTSFWRGKKAAVERNGAVEKAEAKRLPLCSKFPSYIPSRNFAIALLDLVGAGGGEERAADSGLMETLRANAMTLQPGKVRDALLAALAEAGDDFDRARTSLEAWFDAGMDRVSGWYKRESLVILLAIGVVTAVGFNIDALSIRRTLANNNSVRQEILLRAEETQRAIAERAEGGTAAQVRLGLTDDELRQAKAGLGDLIGAPRPPFNVLDGSWWTAVLGWLITAVAISIGAPFWFDLLNKFMVIRATVKPFEKSPAEGSEDRKGGSNAAQRLAAHVPSSAAAGAGGGQPQPEPQHEGPIMGHVRLAVEQAGLTGLALQVDGTAHDLPPDGYLELPLEMGVPHQLSVTATDGKQQLVSWSEEVRLTFEDDLLPVFAELK